MIGEVWYRYVDIQYAPPPLDEWERSLGRGGVKIFLEVYRVVKDTPKGVWLCRDYFLHNQVDKRFVLRDARKRFACPTKEEAMTSFVARKNAQIRIYKSRLERAQRALQELENPMQTLLFT